MNSGRQTSRCSSVKFVSSLTATPALLRVIRRDAQSTFGIHVISSLDCRLDDQVLHRNECMVDRECAME